MTAAPVYFSPEPTPSFTDAAVPSSSMAPGGINAGFQCLGGQQDNETKKG